MNDRSITREDRRRALLLTLAVAERRGLDAAMHAMDGRDRAGQLLLALAEVAIAGRGPNFGDEVRGELLRAAAAEAADEGD